MRRYIYVDRSERREDGGDVEHVVNGKQQLLECDEAVEDVDGEHRGEIVVRPRFAE